MQYLPHAYQQHATDHMIHNDFAGLFLDMGLGKTVSTLTAIDALINDYLTITRVLVIAPLRVAIDTWPEEIKKWDHLKHLTFSLVLGDERKRKKALLDRADIYIINRENIVWLVSHYGSRFPFDMVVIDELSSFKDASTRRFKALKKVRPLIKRVVGLTGTPAPNGLLGLWSQVYLLDRGERLGETLTGYRAKYFSEAGRVGPMVVKYELRKEDKNSILGEGIYEKEIFDRISDICISMKAADYLKLPPRINRIVNVSLDAETMKKYLNFELQQVMALSEEKQISVLNMAGLVNKLLQFSNGAVYDSEKVWHEVHKAKLDALEEIVEAANGNPVLVFYSFKSDADRIAARLKAYEPVKLDSQQDIKNWNEGKTKVLYAHPASAGHGLNLQAGGHIIVWFGLNWSLELYQQANARLDRQGQTKPVIVHHLVCPGTMDEDVVFALDGKAATQDAVMNAVKAKINKLLPHGSS